MCGLVVDRLRESKEAHAQSDGCIARGQKNGPTRPAILRTAHVAHLHIVEFPYRCGRRKAGIWLALEFPVDPLRPQQVLERTARSKIRCKVEGRCDGGRNIKYRDDLLLLHAELFEENL